MSAVQWLIWLVPEMIKTLLITYGIFGFEFKKWRWWFAVAAYIAGGICLCEQGADLLLWKSIRGAVIIFSLFYGKFGRKLVAFLIEYIAIAMVDTMVMSVNMLVTGYEHNFVQSIIDNTLGMAFWIILTVLVYRKRKKVYEFIQTISYGYILLVLVFLLCVCVVAGTSYLVLNGEITQQAMRQTYFFNMLCIVVALVICVVLFYLVFSRKKVQHEKEIEEKVYEREWKRYQSMRSFRHDVKKHLRVLHALGDRGNIEEIRKYIEEIGIEYNQNAVNHTGDFILDYFIDYVINEWKDHADFSYEIDGKFPAEVDLNYRERCILWGNAMDNAKEALEKAEKPFFEIHISHGGRAVFVEMINSCEIKEGNILKTKKADRSQHGIGTANMRDIVKQNGGEITWHYEEGKMHVTISLLI